MRIEDAEITTHVAAAITEAERAGCESHEIFEDVLVSRYGDMDVDQRLVGVAVVGPSGPHEVTLTMAGFKRSGDAWEWRP